MELLHVDAPGIEISLCGGVGAIDAQAWDALVPGDDPFLEHAFLSSLEDSGSVGAGTGWTPRMLLARRGGDLVGAVPLYLKDHSYGEFIFDWGWANGSQRAGIPYFPKLVAAIPFTPASGSRLLVKPGQDVPEVRHALIAGLRQAAEHLRASSVHILFCTEEESEALRVEGFASRLSMQFHWTNRSPTPYRDFDDWLDELASRHRKELRKERRIAAGHGLRLVTLTGPQLDDRAWDALELFYRTNTDKHDNICYLQPAFFPMIRARHAKRVVATLAYQGDTPVAGTLNFERGRQIFGRYWGATQEFDRMHFELCYHQLIDRAIARGVTRFEAGAGGDHKLARGLLPSATHSAHFLRHKGLFAAVRGHLAEEEVLVLAEISQYQTMSPFKKV